MALPGAVARPILAALTCRPFTFVVIAGLGACGGTPPASPPRSPSPADGMACSPESLASFEPDVPVIERGPLPPMEQATEAHTEHLATVPCEQDEDDEACLERAREAARASYPRATAMTAAIGVDRELFRAEVLIGHDEEVVTAESLAELTAKIAELRSAGQPAKVVGLERLPAPDAARSAVVRVTLPGKLRAREAVRAYLVIAPPLNPVVAVLELKLRAALAGVELRAVQPREDGTIRVEIGCQRAIPSAEVLDLQFGDDAEPGDEDGEGQLEGESASSS